MDVGLKKKWAYIGCPAFCSARVNRATENTNTNSRTGLSYLNINNQFKHH